MALTRSKPASIFTPEGNSLAVFIDVADGTLKLKDVFGDVELFTNFVGGGGLNLKDDVLISATLTEVVDKDNTPSILSISTESVGIGTTTSTGLLNLFKPSAAVRLMINGDAGQNRLITYRTGGLQRFGLYVNNTAESGSNVGSDFALRRYTDGGTLGGTPFFIKRSTGNVGINTTTPATTLDVNGTANIAERLTIEADSTATTQSTAVIQNTTLNSGIALVPNGTGAITANIPDGTATGGNARGTNAVDLQTSRIANTNVASGNFSTISGGQSNRASAAHASVIGGQGNSSNGSNSVTGGLNNTASSERSVAIGNQNNASGFGAVISIGNNNTSSGTNSVSIGVNNNTSAQNALSFGGGNTVSGVGSIAIGTGNTITGNGFSLSRDSSITSPNGGTTLGNAALSYLQCQNTLASGTFQFGGLNGFAQQSLLTARKEQENFASGATTVLSLDGTGTTNLIIPNGSDRSWNVRVSTIARVTGITGTATGVSVGNSFMENISILFKKVTNVSSIVGVGTPEIISDTSMATALMTYTVGASQELALTFTAPTFAGGGTLRMRIVSKIELVEVG